MGLHKRIKRTIFLKLLLRRHVQVSFSYVYIEFEKVKWPRILHSRRDYLARSREVTSAALRCRSAFLSDERTRRKYDTSDCRTNRRIWGRLKIDPEPTTWPATQILKSSSEQPIDILKLRPVLSYGAQFKGWFSSHFTCFRSQYLLRHFDFGWISSTPRIRWAFIGC